LRIYRFFIFSFVTWNTEMYRGGCAYPTLVPAPTEVRKISHSIDLVKFILT